MRRIFLFLRVIVMRLFLLLAFMFIVVLQITCNSNQCGRQSELIDCAGIEGQATFIHVKTKPLNSIDLIFRSVVLGNFDWSSDLSTGSDGYCRGIDCTFDC